MQGEPLDHNPRKIPVENSSIKILQNTSKCLLLNDKQMPHEILFNFLQLLDEIQNTKKMKTQESKKRKLKKKSKKNRGSCFNIHIVLFAFFGRLYS